MVSSFLSFYVSLFGWYLNIRSIYFNLMYDLQSEAVVNAGPAVFISQTGPNPIMVQVIFSYLAGF